MTPYNVRHLITKLPVTLVKLNLHIYGSFSENYKDFEKLHFQQLQILKNSISNERRVLNKILRKQWKKFKRILSRLLF